MTKSPRYFYDHEAIKEKTLTFDTSVRDRENSRLNNTPGRTKSGGLLKNDYETRNKRSVWHVPTKPYSGAHFATFPTELIEPCIKAGCPAGGLVLDPFGGAGTTGIVADRLQRNAVLIELNPDYAMIAENRIKGDSPLFSRDNHEKA